MLSVGRAGHGNMGSLCCQVPAYAAKKVGYADKVQNPRRMNGTLHAPSKCLVLA